MRVGTNGIQLAVHDGGDGAPMMLLHGFPLSSGVFEPVRPVLERAGRLVTVDLRGFGESDAPEAPYGMADLAGDVLAVADRLGLERFALGGHSMGGYVALQLAAQHPERLSGLVLIDTRAAADSPEAAQRRREAVDTIRDGDRKGFLDGFLEGLVGPSTRQRQPDVLPCLRAMAERVPDHVLVGCLEGMRLRSDHREVLRSLDVPALVMVGAEDELVPAAEARDMADDLPQGRLKVVPGSGHTPTMERPVAVGDAVAVFLRELPAP